MSTKSSSVSDYKFEDHLKSESSSSRKPAIAEKLEAEYRELLEKRQSLTKESIAERLEAAGEKRQEILDAKVNVAKEMEHPKKVQESGSGQQMEKEK